MRDPSSILIAFFMPVLLLFIFGYGINLDFSRLRIGLRMEDAGAEAAAFAAALKGSPWLEVHAYDSRAAMERRWWIRKSAASSSFLRISPAK